nr:hypothetical protein [Tanacetum cinerariifolium]
MLINNVCEVFNRQLLDDRDRLIITALEFVKEYLMKRIVIVQKFIQKCDGPLTPAISKLFDKIKAASTRCSVEWNCSELYQVNPVNGRDTWSKYNCPTTLLPPKVHPQIRRPPNKRKKSKGELVMVKGNKLTRQGEIVTCSLCQATGHNKTSCSSVSSQRNESVSKKTTGTKRTSRVTGTSIVAAEVGKQASQAGTQASTGSTFKRTKNNASKITPKK